MILYFFIDRVGGSFTLFFFFRSLFGRAVPPVRCCPGGKAVSPTVTYWGYPYSNIYGYIDMRIACPFGLSFNIPPRHAPHFSGTLCLVTICFSLLAWLVLVLGIGVVLGVIGIHLPLPVLTSLSFGLNLHGGCLSLVGLWGVSLLHALRQG